MQQITESHVEIMSIQRLESLGYNYLYGPDIAPDGHSPKEIHLSRFCYLVG